MTEGHKALPVWFEHTLPKYQPSLSVVWKTVATGGFLSWEPSRISLSILRNIHSTKIYHITLRLDPQTVLTQKKTYII